MDFLLKKEEIVIEVKKTRSGLTSNKIGEQLIIDIEKYKEHPDCKTLVCFVYDPEGRIANPRGVEADLESRCQDMILRVLEDLAWHGIFHKIRMSPGKPVGFGLLEDKPVFCLPGSPPSNELAFLQLALPGLMKMRGEQKAPFPFVRAQLCKSLSGRKDWTQFIHGNIVIGKSKDLMIEPLLKGSRLKAMAKKEAFIIIPEGCEKLIESERVDIQILRPIPLFPYDK